MKNKIQVEMIKAMKSKDKKLLTVLRDIKNRLDEAEKNKKQLTEKDCIKVLNKMAKERNQSIDAYKKADRKDLLDKEQFELDIIEKYLPKKMSDNEIEEVVVRIVRDNGYGNMKDMGKVMKEFNKNHSGQDGKIVSDIVKKILNS